MEGKKFRVLFLYSQTGGGHRSSVEAIMEAMREKYGEAVVMEAVDFMTEYARGPYRKSPELYNKMTRVPGSWALGFHLSNGRWRKRFFEWISRPFFKKGFSRLIEEHPCDLVVSAHALANKPLLEALGNLDKQGKNRPTFAVVVTDLVSVHSSWFHTVADLTIVPTAEAKKTALAFGLEEKKVEALGFPIRRDFVKELEGGAVLREKLGWKGSLPVVLLMGGADGMGPIEKIFLHLIQAKLPISIAVVCGKNKALYARLKPYSSEEGVYVYGLVKEELPAMMHAASVLLSKAGSGTVCEALRCALPILFYHRIPGQEVGNVDYVVQGGAGFWTPQLGQMLERLEYWLKDGEAYESAVVACKKLAQPRAADEIAKRLMRFNF